MYSILAAKEEGTKQFESFVSDRIVNTGVDLFKPISKNNINVAPTTEKDW